MQIEFFENDTTDERLRKQLEFEKELNRKLINGLEIYNRELTYISQARHLTADELRAYAFECLLRYGEYKK